MNYTMEKDFNTSGRTVRLPYMDVAKGMGILCVIIGHMGNEAINRIIFSLHMPLFFLISGYFLSNRLTPKEVYFGNLILRNISLSQLCC